MEQGKEPHSISLKVLRLSRPSLSEQYPLPALTEGDVASIDVRASLSHAETADRSFILSPLLSLPTGFGTAFVGSTFSCTICANNELPEEGDRGISSIQINAEVTTPTQASTLKLSPTDSEGDAPHQGLEFGATLQKLLRFDLREEGPHTLAVGVTYETTSRSDGVITGRRTRSFRKLYQFAAVPCLSVRTKATDLLAASGADTRDARKVLERTGERFALEAQLENLTDGPITLEKVSFDSKAPFESVSLNWDASAGTELAQAHLSAPTLSPRAVTQVCYLIQEDEKAVAAGGVQKEMTKDGRLVLGTLSIKWRGPMGEPGVLSTGWLTSKRR